MPGFLLLNISPRADGSIPMEQKYSLLGVGDWLKVNGEAIYGTRPFKIYGEGPKRMESSGHFVQMNGEYSAENIRFTTKENCLYVIQMGWLGSHEEFTINSLNLDSLANTEIKDVSVIGSDESVEWEISDEGLKVRTPFKAPNKSAVVFKIDTDDLGLIVLDDQAEAVAPITVDG